jgi:dipeptidyl aminopeptidase/acylaminoacyl peptidase
MRDGVALFLLLREGTSPKRLTPYELDAQVAMAVWAPDGSAFAVPVPGGLAVFGPTGLGLSRMTSLGGEVHSPAFSADGTRVAFVEGSGIGVWNLATEQREWAMEPAKDGTFPRLSGWSPWGDGPLFTRGSDYTRLERDGEGRLLLSEEVPLETATGAMARILSPIGRAPLRRFKAQPVSGGVFYLAHHPGGAPGLYLFDGRAERMWSREGDSVLGFEALSTRDCWAWVSAPNGNARLVRYSGPGQEQTAGPALKASLLALTVQGSGEAWFSGVPSGDSRRRLFRAGPNVGDPVGCDCDDIWGISAAGGTLAVVAAQRSPDGEGSHPSWGRGELWILWRTP